MHRIKRGWLAAVLLALGVGIASAQAPDGPPPGPPPEDGGGPPTMADHAPGPQRELKTLTKLLSLTADQQTGVKAILEEQSAAMRALRAKSQSSSPEDSNTPEARQARMAQVEQIRNESNTKINALLNDNQKKTFADWIAKRKAAMERRRQGEGDGPPPPPPDGGGPPAE
jgi:protein CpxP